MKTELYIQKLGVCKKVTDKTHGASFIVHVAKTFFSIVPEAVLSDAYALDKLALRSNSSRLRGSVRRRLTHPENRELLKTAK